MRRVGVLLACLLCAGIAGCGADDPPPVAAPGPMFPTSAAPSAPVSTSVPASTPPAPSSTSVRAPSSSARVAGAPVVVLDPGHNGGNASHPGEINRLVPAGRGARKPCNTTGTATNAGYPEHAFTFDVAQRVRTLLTARGVSVQLTRPDDNGVGPCVDRRAALGNQANAAAVVSIHADGSTSAAARGFHVSYSAPALNAAQGAPSSTLAGALRDALRGAGFPTSTYLGSAGIYPRADLAGLNLSTRPAVLVECGNMRNAGEAAAMSTPDGRQRYAAAIANGILADLAPGGR